MFQIRRHRANEYRRILPLALILIAAFLTTLGCSGSGDMVAAVAEDAPASEPAASTAGSVSPQAYGGIETGFTAEGYPYLGGPNAPVILEEWSDYLCPFCARHFNETLPSLIEEYVATGKVKLVFRDFPIPSLHPAAPLGAQAANCVAEQGAGAYWAMHDELFRTQDQWRALSDPGEFLALAAERIGADPVAYGECMETGRQDARVVQSIADGQTLGFNSTPSFRFLRAGNAEAHTLVGAQPVEAFAQWLDALLAGEELPQPVEAEPATPEELPFWSNPETGLAPDPARRGFTLAGDPYKGSPEAPLVVIEFSDFQCPSCRRHALEAQPILEAQFVESGQIRWVFKNWPLKSHAQAQVAAAAGECAADQGEFWEMATLMFETVENWSIEVPDPEFLRLAEQLDLDMEAFASCLSGRGALERVLSDQDDGDGLVQSTPTFIGVYGGAGYVFRGARGAEEFTPLLQEMVRKAREGE
jgi:protein-disulfide isomerase